MHFYKHYGNLERQLQFILIIETQVLGNVKVKARWERRAMKS